MSTDATVALLLSFFAVISWPLTLMASQLVSFSLPATFVERSMRKRADIPQGSVLAIKNLLTVNIA